jgi:hypothetical protein
MKEDSEPFISSIDIGYIHKTARLESGRSQSRNSSE